MRSLHFIACLACSASVVAEEKRGDAPDAPPSTPQQQRTMFHVPPGFEVQLVASEPDIQKPLNLNFDAAGRLWATGSELYPWPARTDANGKAIADFDKAWKEMTDAFRVGDKAPEPAPAGKDTVRILSDFAPDGRARKIVTFADGLNIPTGIQPLHRGLDFQSGKRGADFQSAPGRIENPSHDTAIVFSIPNIWRMTDTDGDGRADVREPLYTGFGFTDTHGMSSNYLYWIDGWIYGCHGFRNHSEVKDRAGRVTVFDSGNTYRFRPDGSQIEYYTHGQTNPFGLTVDPLGNFFSADSHSKPVMMLIRGGYYAGIGKSHDGLGFAPTITDDDHGSSAIAGIAYYADDKFPEEYRGNLFNGNPVTRRINRDRLEWHGSTPRAIRMPDFLTCDDPWFRPVQVKLGPDGALWIADFYNPIIGHYEVPLTDPRRDHTHGRIWRVVWTGKDWVAGAPGSAPVAGAGGGVPPPRTSSDVQSPNASAHIERTQEVRRSETPRPAPGTGALPGPAAAPDLTALDAAGLVEKLADPNLIVRSLATNELVERVGKEAVSVVRRAALNAENHVQISEMLWALERWQSLNEELFGAALTGDSGGTVLSATQLLTERAALVGDSTGFPTVADIVRILGEKVYESEPAIGRAAAIGLGRCPSFLNILQLLMRWDAPTGDTALAYSARIALRDTLKRPGVYAEIEKRIVRVDSVVLGSSFDDPRFHPESVARLAEVSLAVSTPAAATFLLTYLQRSKLADPRASEYLHHAVLHLPEEKLGAVSTLLQPLADAPLAQRFALADGLGQAARERAWKMPDDLAAWTQRTLLAALDGSDAPLADRAIAAVREMRFEDKREPLLKIVHEAKQSGQRRAAALEALMNLPDTTEVAVQALNDPASMPLRKKAAELLGARGDTGAALLTALPTAPTELAIVIAVMLAWTDAGCGQLLDTIASGKASATLLRSKFVAFTIAGRERGLQERAAALAKDLPPEDARLDGVIAERAGAYRKREAGSADEERGALVFEQHCVVCHRFRNVGGNVGPNLDGVAARGVQRLVEDILDPHRNVDPAFRQTIVETHAGVTFAGANLREDGAAITLTDATGKDATFAKADLKSRTGSKLSLMPAIFETQISAAEFHDLLTYLLGAVKP